MEDPTVAGSKPENEHPATLLSVMSGEAKEGTTEADQCTLDAKEQKMRDEIHSLQEKRADVLMNEVDELKKQKEKALSKASKLEKALKELNAENAALRLEAETREATQLQIIEQALTSLQEDKDMLTKKLTDASKQNDSLRLRLQRTESELQQMKHRRGIKDQIEVPFLSNSPRSTVGAPGSHSPRLVLGQDADTGMRTATGGDEGEVAQSLSREQQSQVVSPSHKSTPATGWMDEEGRGGLSEQEQSTSGGHAKGPREKRRHSSSQEAVRVQGLFASRTPPLSHIRPRQHGFQYSPSPLLGTHCHSVGDLFSAGVTSTNATPLGGTPSTSAQNSPSVRTKRFVLSTAAKRDAETQTALDIWSLEEQGALSATELQSTLLQVRETITALNEENEALVRSLASKEDEVQDNQERYQALVGTLKSYQSECEELRQSMDGVVQLVKDKIAEFQEELDFARIIYSLHGSLSQESTVIEAMCQKLKDSQTRVGELECENSTLKTELSHVKDKLAEVKLKYKQMSPKKTVHKPPISPHPLPLAHQLLRSLRDTPSPPPQPQFGGVTLQGPPTTI